MWILQADPERQLQLVGKGVKGGEGAAGEQHAAYMHGRQLAHANSW